MVYAHFGFECNVPKCEIVDSLCSIWNAINAALVAHTESRGEKSETLRCNFVRPPRQRRRRRATVFEMYRVPKHLMNFYEVSAAAAAMPTEPELNGHGVILILIIIIIPVNSVFVRYSVTVTVAVDNVRLLFVESNLNIASNARSH